MSHNKGVKFTVKLVAMSFTIGASALVVAQLPPSRAGVNAFNEGEYAQALEYFRQAEQAGNEALSLQYNIAVSLYRLGQYSEARERFLLLGEHDDWRVLTTYNLGLVAESLGNDSLARDYFLQSVAQEEHERVREAASRKLEAMDRRQQTADRGSMTSSQEPGSPQRWAAIARLTGGWDSNASSLADDLLDDRARADDLYSEQLLYGHLQASGRARDGMRVYGMLFNRGFHDFSHLNSQVLSLGGVFEVPVGAYRTEAGIRMNVTQLDGSRVAEQYQIHAGAARDFSFGTVGASHAFARFEAGPRFSQIQGYQNRTELDWRNRIDNLSVRLRYRFELNDRQDLQRNGAFASYSPTRHGLMLDLRNHLTPSLSSGVRVEHLSSRYDGTNRLRDTNGEVRERGRRTRQNRMTADVDYRLGGSWRLRGEYQFTDQRDNFALYTYDKHRVSATVEYRW